MNKDKYKKMKKEYNDLTNQYLKDKFEIKDKATNDLRELKYAYNYNKILIKKPLKAEKYKLKVEKKRLNRIKNSPPKRLLLEEIGNAISHGLGAIFAIVALILMILKSDNGYKLTSSIIFGTCMFLCMLSSSLYHSWRNGSTVKRIFRRFDYTSIYLLLGGTFTPIFLIYKSGSIGITLCAIVWVIIITGITMVCIFGPGRLKWLHFSLYFIVGWSALIFVPSWLKNNKEFFYWILGGGLAYSLGMIPFAALAKKNVAHFIWHIFVLLGVILHFFGIYICLY